ncbi:MAG: hypothetical protein ACYC6L_18355, partial [Anaerolineae bacterium]
ADASPADSAANLPRPVVLIEPSGLGNRSTNEALAAELASHGMVVLTLDHPGQSLFIKLANGFQLPSRRYLEEALAYESGLLPVADALSLAGPWQTQRITDWYAVIAYLEQRALPLGKLDLHNLGVIGYGLG